MPTYFIAAAVLLATAYGIHVVRCLQSNITAAKQSGLPYVVLPVWTFNRFWLVTHRLWLPLIRRLPRSWTREWIEYVRLRPIYNIIAADIDLATWCLITYGINGTTALRKLGLMPSSWLRLE